MNQEIVGYKYKDIQAIFNTDITKQALLKAEKENRIPTSKRVQYGNSKISHRIWDLEAVTKIGEKYGFLTKPKKPTCISVFSTKGGVLKSTISLNIARLYALHNIKTCVIDLDPQADVSRNLGFDIHEDDISEIADLDNYYKGIGNISDYYNQKINLQDIIQNSEIPSLDVIPASSELIPLMDILNTEVRREFWLKENIISNLYELGYEMVIIDLAPSWNIYTTMAISASNILVSPLECRIAHYRNSTEFIKQLNRFTNKMKLNNLKKLFIPTKVSSSKKIYMQIRQSYASNIEDCSLSAIRESIIGEESVAKRISVIEYAPKKEISDDMRNFLIELDGKVKQDI